MINRWLVSLFLQGTSETYQTIIWDFFLLEGNIIIFKAAYALLKQLEKYLDNSKSLEEMQIIFQKTTETFNIR